MNFATFGRKLRRVRSMPTGVLLRELLWRSFKVLLAIMDRAVVARRPGSRRVGGRIQRGLISPEVAVALRSARVLRPPSGIDVGACVEEADRALAGQFVVLGHGYVDFGSPTRWHDDPLRGHTWDSVHHGRLGPVPGVADIKVPWEASRLHWMVALARAHGFTGDERYLEGALALLRSWDAANPMGVGPNWVTPMEVGIRLTNLAWAAEILDDREIDSLVHDLALEHAWHLLRNLEYSPSLTSNHFLGNVCGLAHAATLLRHRPIGRWLGRLSRAMLIREVAKQFHDDGSNFEASTGYHRLSTELCLLTAHALAALGRPVPEDTRRRLVRAVQALDVMTGPLERLPAIGDDDSGLATGLVSGRHPRDGRQLSALLHDCSDGAAAELGWWLGPVLGAASRDSRTALPDSGLFSLRGERLWVLADCGGVGQKGNGGHAHNDTLAFVLAVDGTLVVGDPGSGAYSGDPALRNALRSARAHATVVVDGEEPNRFDERLLFTMRDEDAPTVHDYRHGPGAGVLEASHHGYCRLRDPVEHRRRWQCDATGLVVTDVLTCSDRHSVEVVLPLAPGVAVEDVAGPVMVRAGAVSVRIDTSGDVDLAWRVEPRPYADRYGSVVESSALVAYAEIVGPVSWDIRFDVLETPLGKDT